MTKVAITESYAVGCPECTENLVRLVQWSGRDSQVSSLTFRAVPRCDHALPAPKPKQMPKPPVTLSQTPKPTPLPPHGGTPLFGATMNGIDVMAGTGYDEPETVA